MKFKIPFLYLFVFLFITFLFFNPVFISGKLPIPADTIIGLYHPYRDLYASEYPRGIPFHNSQITDPVRQQYPWKVLSIDSLKSGQLPLWNPYNFAGTPLLANMQSAVFYPLNIFFFIMPYQFAWSLLIVSQPILAGVFMFLFLRNLQLSRYASLFGSLSFAFCGFFVSWMEWGNVVSTGLWLPLVLLAIDKIFSGVTNTKLKEKRATFLLKFKELFCWYGIFVLCLTFSFFAGHLQVFFYSVVVAAGYFFARWWQFRRSKTIFFLFLFLTACFLFLTFIQWFPTIQFILQSGRTIDQDWQKLGWFVPWENLTQFIVPDFFGNPSTLNYWGVWNYGEFVGYIGFFPLLFALYAIFFSKRKIVWFFTALVFAGLLFAFPTILAKVPFEFSIPFLSTSQPTRLIFVVDFSLSVLAAFGLQYFLEKRRWIVIPYSLLVVIIVLFWGYVLFNHQLPTTLQTTIENLAVTKNNLKLPSLLLVASGLLIGLYLLFIKQMKYAKIIFLLGLFILTIGDLYRFTTKYITFAEQTYLFPETKVLSFLQNQGGPFRVMSTDSRVFPPNFSAMYHIQTPDGYDPLFTERYAEFAAAISRGKPDINPPFGFNRIITVQNSESFFIDLLNIRYLLSLRELDSEHFKKIMSEGETIVYENTNVLPRTFFVNEVRQASGKQDTIEKLFSLERQLHEKAVVEGMEKKTAEALVNKQSSSVVITSYTSNRVVLETENIGEKFLVLSDAYYPTWHVNICNEEESECKGTTIYVTNYAFRGVIVPAGKHHVIFENRLL